MNRGYDIIYKRKDEKNFWKLFDQKIGSEPEKIKFDTRIIFLVYRMLSNGPEA